MQTREIHFGASFEQPPEPDREQEEFSPAVRRAAFVRIWSEKLSPAEQRLILTADDTAYEAALNALHDAAAARGSNAEQQIREKENLYQYFRDKLQEETYRTWIAEAAAADDAATSIESAEMKHIRACGFEPMPNEAGVFYLNPLDTRFAGAASRKSWDRGLAAIKARLEREGLDLDAYNLSYPTPEQAEALLPVLSDATDKDIAVFTDTPASAKALKRALGEPVFMEKTYSHPDVVPLHPTMDVFAVPVLTMKQNNNEREAA